MRRKFVAANWKMNLHWNEALTLFTSLIETEQNSDWSGVDVGVFPPFIYSRHMFEVSKNYRSQVVLGAQNCASTENGAFTGEVSASMLSEIGLTSVIIGHSERRDYFCENGNVLVEKLNRGLASGLNAIYCCGEQLEDRQNGNHENIIASQLKEELFSLSADDLKNVVIAYEPVWAIGTGETATPDQAQEMHAFIRSIVQEKYGKETAEAIQILYGGSVKPNNAREIFGQPDVDGGLIGGAALDHDSFVAIIEAAKEVS